LAVVVVVELPEWPAEVVDVVGRMVVVVVGGVVVDVVVVVVVKVPTTFPPGSEQVPLALQVIPPELGG
jgi:hypothetical protein